MDRTGVLFARSVHIRFAWRGRPSEVCIRLSCRTPGLHASVLFLRRDVLGRWRAGPCACACTLCRHPALRLVVRPSLDRVWGAGRRGGWALSTAGRCVSADMRILSGSVLYGDLGKVWAAWQ